jgi:hypothetical protein
VDAQFDSFRPNNIWVLKYFVNKDLYSLQRAFVDCVNVHDDTNEDSKTVEEFVFSPNLMKKGYFEPTDMTQFVNTQLNFEFVFLLTDVKMSVLGRQYKEGSQDEFVAYFTLDYIDIMGIKRKMSLMDDFCDV